MRVQVCKGVRFLFAKMERRVCVGREPSQRAHTSDAVSGGGMLMGGWLSRCARVCVFLCVCVCVVCIGVCVKVCRGV